MKLIAHRGLYETKEEENTLESFFNTINNDCYVGFECDVRQTKDKKFIIHHDAFSNDQIIKLTKLKKLKNQNILLLSDLLKINTNKIILLEIKDMDIDINKFNKILRKYKNKNIYIMSFHNKVISKLNKTNHCYKLGVLNYVLNSQDDYNYDFIGLLNNLATKKQIDEYLKDNIEVFIYGLLKTKKLIHGEECYYIVDQFCL